MTEIWEDNNNKKFSIDLRDCEFNCKTITLPVIINFSESSEESLIQLRHLYISFLNMLYKYPYSKTGFENAPWEVVEKLNFVSKSFVNYLYFIGVKYYFVFSDAINMDSVNKTPFCSLLMSDIQTSIEKIDEELSQKGIHLFKYSTMDYDLD